MKPKQILFYILIVVTILVGGFVRLWQLEDIPVSMHQTEAKIGLMALEANETGEFKVSYEQGNGWDGMYTNFVALFLEILGPDNGGVSNFAVRFASCFFGILTLIGFYLLIKELNLSRLSQFVGVFMLATSFWHLMFSRLVHSAIMIPFLLAWTAYFLLRAIKCKQKTEKFLNHRRIMFFTLAGLLIGAGLILSFVGSSANNQGSITGLFGLLDMSFPLAWLVIFGLGFLISLKEIYAVVFGRVKLKLNKGKVQFSSLFILSIMAQVIFWVIFIFNFSKVEKFADLLQISGLIVPVFLFCLLPFEYAFGIYKRVKESPRLPLKPWRWNVLRFSFWGLVATALVTGLLQIVVYFYVWAPNPNVAKHFEKELFDLGKLVKQLPTKEKNYLITDSNRIIGEDHADCDMKTMIFSAQPKIGEYLFYKPMDAIEEIDCAGETQIVFQKSDEWLRERFKEKCYDIEFKEKIAPGAKNSFWVIQ